MEVQVARTSGSNSHPASVGSRMWFTASWVHVRSADCLLSIPAGYTSVQQTGIVDAVEERSQVRFTPSQSNTCVAIAVETVGIPFCVVFGVMVKSTAGSGPSEYPV